MMHSDVWLINSVGQSIIGWRPMTTNWWYMGCFWRVMSGGNIAWQLGIFFFPLQFSLSLFLSLSNLSILKDFRYCSFLVHYLKSLWPTLSSVMWWRCSNLHHLSTGVEEFKQIPPWHMYAFYVYTFTMTIYATPLRHTREPLTPVQCFMGGNLLETTLGSWPCGSWAPWNSGLP